MSKNRSYSFKSKNVVSIVFALLFLLIGLIASTFAFLVPSIEKIANSKQIVSIYKETKYDFCIRSTTEEGLASVKSISSIDESADFYHGLGEIKTPKGEANICIRSLVDNSKLYLTEYTDTRIIKKIANSSSEAFLSESFANSYGYFIGSTIKISGIEFVVTRIYRDSSDISIVYIPNFADKIHEKFGETLTASGVYVFCSNKDDFALKANAINGLIIQDKMSGYEDKNKKSVELLNSAREGFALFSILTGGLYLLSSIGYLAIFAKKIKKELVDNGKKELLLRASYTHFISALLGFVFSLFGMIIISSISKVYVDFVQVFSIGWFSILILFAFIVAAFLSNTFFINASYKKPSSFKTPKENFGGYEEKIKE